jgi:parallel beta-helix repeat protein
VGFYEQGNVNHNGRTIGGIAYSQQQEVIITGVTGTGTGPYTVTISNGVFPNNIRASQTPGAWWFLPTQQVSHDGTENLTVVHGVSAVFLSSLTGFAPGNYLLGATSGSTAYITRIGQFSQSVQFAAQQGGQFVVSETIQQTATRGGPPTGVSATNNANTNQGGVSTAVAQFSCYQCWERNVRSENAGQQHAFIYQSYQSVIRDSYFFAAQAHGTQSYGLEVTASSNALIENNIFQQNTNCVLLSNSSGSVVDYNYSVFEGFQNANGTPNPFLIGADAHNAGHTMNLWEGNNFSVIWSDIYWGPGSTGTLFRNMLRGWEPGKTRTTNPMRNGSKIRVFNVVGNVLGQPLYHMHYQSNATSTTAGVNGDATNAANVSIYSLGWSGNTGDAGCNFPPTCDPLTTSTLMRWGNYTTVGPGDTPAQVTFDSTEASPAAVPFANANFTPAYFSSLSHALPASLYYTSRPSWWPTSKAFPPIGPDVTSGNLGTCAAGVFMGAQAITATQCASDLTPQYAGHATSIPAQDCYLNIMGGPPDGSGNVLNFDANVCYYAAAPITPPAPPTGLTAQILFPILGGGNPASRFNCASISGCVLWYRSDSTSGNGPQCSGSPCANGAQVTAWIDSSPSHNNAGPITPNSGCTYATALLNGHGGVFSPNFTSPACTMPITTPVAWNVSYTVFAVFRPTGGVTTTNPVLSGAPGVTMPSYRFTSSTGNQAIVKPGAANVIAGTLPLVSGTFHQGNASYNSTTTAASLRLNRALDNSAATTSSGSTTGSLNSILGESSPALPLQGNVLEIIVYIPQLSTTDITTVETYLNQKYGI